MILRVILEAVGVSRACDDGSLDDKAAGLLSDRPATLFLPVLIVVKSIIRIPRTLKSNRFVNADPSLILSRACVSPVSNLGPSR